MSRAQCCASATSPPFLNRGSGIVTFGSIAALTGMPRRDAYTASKGAIVALTRAWATDLIRLGIRVNCVAPGVVATPMTENLGSAAGSISLSVEWRRRTKLPT